MSRRLLHLEASPRGPRSRSSMVANAFIEALEDVDADRLNLFTADLPHFDGPVIEGRYALIAGQGVLPEVAASWREIEAHVEKLLSYDIWLISTPMWNFGIPYPLKHYIDVVTQPNMLFRVAEAGVVGMAEGRTAIVVGSGALDIDWQNGDPLDHQMAFLKTWLAFVGVSDVRTVDLRPTYGAEEDVDAATERSKQEARALAQALR